jgi:hypothetical protein
MRAHDDEWPGFSPAVTADDYVPASHRSLPMVRVFLPFRDAAGGVVRWSRYVDVGARPASLPWSEVLSEVGDSHPSARDLVSSMGVLDAETAAALREAIGGLSLRCLRWEGYADTAASGPRIRVLGDEYCQSELQPDDLQEGRRLPGFAWDADGRLAWGGSLYPDSLIVAAEKSILEQLRADARLDSASIEAGIDRLPRSAGD